MGRPRIGLEAMTSSERSRRRRARLRAAHVQAAAQQPEAAACAWCGRGGVLVGDHGVMICAPCIEQASIEIAEARAARKRAAVGMWDDDVIDPLPDSTRAS
jgi:hypothetical protein